LPELEELEELEPQMSELILSEQEKLDEVSHSLVEEESQDQLSEERPQDEELEESHGALDEELLGHSALEELETQGAADEELETHGAEVLELEQGVGAGADPVQIGWSCSAQEAAAVMVPAFNWRQAPP